ncbi:MAG: hypothetical protein KC561_18355, partial [Myxococcales bacterium]|nr:hypothetical protein [Myxococcales bacterium]
ERWDSEPTSTYPTEPLNFADRADGNSYGLPRGNRTSIEELIAMFPDESDILLAEDYGPAPVGDEECGRFSNVIETDELPVIIEGVVTLHPRQFIKPGVCGQDERHYGSFTIEDDTGGIVVLRDSRVTPYTFGDVVRVEVIALMRTFGPDDDTRAILASNIELAEQRFTESDGVRQVDDTILYTEVDGGLSADDVAKVYRAEGFVFQAPTNENFSQMILGEAMVDPESGSRASNSGPLFTCELTCSGSQRCRQNCDSEDFCEAACVQLCEQIASNTPEGQNVVAPPIEDVPACWYVGLDVELGRRGFAPALGSHLRATGPVVNDFDRQIWIGSIGQIELLD